MLSREEVKASGGKYFLQAQNPIYKSEHHARGNVRRPVGTYPAMEQSLNRQDSFGSFNCFGIEVLSSSKNTTPTVQYRIVCSGPNDWHEPQTALVRFW